MKSDASKLIKNFFKLENTPKDKAMAKKLQAAMIMEEYANGDLICKKGEKAKAMFFIESGKVEVIGTNNQVLNELEQGAYFGEYAVLTGDKRLSSVRSKGGTVVYRLKSKDVFLGIRYKPSAYGDMIKKLYGQISSKHTKLLTLSSSRRGLVRDPKNKKRMSLTKLLIHYGVILAIFLLAAFLPASENPAPAWVLLPIAFLIANIIITKRSLESIVLASLLAVVILFKFNFIFVFYDSLIGTVSDGRTMEIILILFLLGSVSRLLSSSGGINAMRRMVSERIQTQQGSLLTSLLCIIIIFVDDCLSMLIAGVCFMPVNDKKRVSREMSAFVMGMSPVAVGTLIPLSVCGVFLIGIITLTIGENGAALFYKSIPFNFASILIILIAFFAATGKMPLIGALKKAYNRVKKGGSLWPPNSENYFAENDESTRGNVINLFLPIFVLIASSIISGSITEGKFAINIGYGLLITLGFMFLLYIFQRLMTPEEFFDNIITGAENMLVPVILLAVTLCFSTSVSQLGLIEWLSEVMSVFSGDNVWMLPAVLYILFTVISALLGSSMSMYVFGLPIAIQLAIAVGGNLPLCIGAICAAGVTGDGLSFYQADNLFVASVIGIEPTAIVTARFPYFLIITLLVATGYVVAGIVV